MNNRFKTISEALQRSLIYQCGIYDPDNGEQITFINGKKVERTTWYTYKPPTLSKVYKVDGKEVRKQVPHPKAEEIIKRLPNYNPEEYGKDKDH